MPEQYITNSAEETIELGKKLGAKLKGGEVIALTGQLGTGKTHIIKGIVHGAGAEDQETSVNSPTFVIVNEYRGRFDIYHIDAYRIESTKEFEMLGFDDFLYPDSVVLVEWADKVSDIIETTEHIKIQMEHVAQTQRQITITWPGE